MDGVKGSERRMEEEEKNKRERRKRGRRKAPQDLQRGQSYHSYRRLPLVGRGRMGITSLTVPPHIFCTTSSVMPEHSLHLTSHIRPQQRFKHVNWRAYFGSIICLIISRVFERVALTETSVKYYQWSIQAPF
jgi:uncharacterized integral membrane protein